tara:strand:- start:786 stop:941 length:156 start_codon:yes stop_codon:yes gene_type:complete
MGDYSTEEKAIPDYGVSYRPADLGLTPVVPKVVVDGKRLNRFKKRTSAGIL